MKDHLLVFHISIYSGDVFLSIVLEWLLQRTITQQDIKSSIRKFTRLRNALASIPKLQNYCLQLWKLEKEMQNAKFFRHWSHYLILQNPKAPACWQGPKSTWARTSLWNVHSQYITCHVLLQNLNGLTHICQGKKQGDLLFICARA